LNQVAHVFGQGWTAKGPPLAQAAPVVAKPFALPCKHGPRLDKRQGLLPARP
jgi:hypothetical protein